MRRIKKVTLQKRDRVLKRKNEEKMKKTAREVDTYSLIVEEKVTSRSMKSVLSQTDQVKLKKMHIKLEVEKSEHFIEMNIIY